ncbi:MAG: CPBP family intramembrane metalloprotease [Faecalibacterium sp.]|nr:CPBP family intramembrane metalloprotease [Faecalibacterium sp.]MDY5505221.1 CPBP family intramembrane glutamic endopeptidase [Faecalibacterium sp.]
MEQNEKTRALLAAFGCALAYLLAGKALGAVLPQVPEEAARMWAFVHRCAAAPIVEELVFRGAIQQLAQPLGRWQAAALQAVLFAVQHGTPAGMAWALGCGLVLGALRECTGRVWPGMLLHTLNNLLVFAAG